MSAQGIGLQLVDAELFRLRQIFGPELPGDAAFTGSFLADCVDEAKCSGLLDDHSAHPLAPVGPYSMRHWANSQQGGRPLTRSTLNSHYSPQQADPVDGDKKRRRGRRPGMTEINLQRMPVARQMAIGIADGTYPDTISAIRKLGDLDECRSATELKSREDKWRDLIKKASVGIDPG